MTVIKVGIWCGCCFNSSQLGCWNTPDLVIAIFAASPDLDQRVLFSQELHQALPGFETGFDGIGFWAGSIHKGSEPVSLQLFARQLLVCRIGAKQPASLSFG